MVLGERAEAIVVRGGAERAEVSAEFDAGRREDIARWLSDNDLAGDDGALLLRRVIDSSGRSRGFINGRASTLAQLREAGEFLVDIHGQHEHQSLARAAAQRGLLDAYGSLRCGGQSAGCTALAAARETELPFETGAAAFAAEREQLDGRVELDGLRLGRGDWPS